MPIKIFLSIIAGMTLGAIIVAVVMHYAIVTKPEAERKTAKASAWMTWCVHANRMSYDECKVLDR